MFRIGSQAGGRWALIVGTHDMYFNAGLQSHMSGAAVLRWGLAGYHPCMFDELEM
jgi:hypothetical protein